MSKKDPCIIVFLGPPGAGKGSLSQMCVQKFGWDLLSTGDLCRKEIEKKNEIGKKIDFILRSGKLIPNELVTQMVIEWFNLHAPIKQTVILDGYPRTYTQAAALHRFLKGNLQLLEVRVIHLKISDEAVILRLGARLICKNKDCQAIYSASRVSMLHPRVDMVCDHCGSGLVRRTDDHTQEIISDRLRVYHENEQDILNFYHNVGSIPFVLNADRSLSEIFDEFQRLVIERGCE